MDEPWSLTADEILALDAQYQPFPPFADWPTASSLDLALWERTCAELGSLPEDGRAADYANARELAMRAAAFETGAIEGLYNTDRGTTMSVATQANAWQSAVRSQGPNALALFEAQLRVYRDVLEDSTR